jgi:plasmid stability protein
MKKITVSLDDQTAAGVRVEAVRDGKSLSRWIRDLLRQRLSESQEYDSAMQSYLARPPFGLQPGTCLPTRDEIYNRPLPR